MKLLKLSIDWRPRRLPELIERLYKVVQFQMGDLRRALYDHGSISHSGIRIEGKRKKGKRKEVKQKNGKLKCSRKKGNGKLGNLAIVFVHGSFCPVDYFVLCASIFIYTVPTLELNMPCLNLPLDPSLSHSHAHLCCGARA